LSAKFDLSFIVTVPISCCFCSVFCKQNVSKFIFSAQYESYFL
jgi:hypothetical protein